MTQPDPAVLDESYSAAPSAAARRNARKVVKQPPRSETDITKECLLWLRSLPGCYAYKLHTGPLSSERGHPDIDACVRGRAVKIEMKRPGEKPDQLQMRRLMSWRAAGALVGWATSLDEVQALVAHAEGHWVNPLTGPGAPEVPQG